MLPKHLFLFKKKKEKKRMDPEKWTKQIQQEKVVQY